MSQNLNCLFIFVCLACCIQVKGQDSLSLLQVERLNVSSNTYGTNISVPDFSDYANDFRFGNLFTTAQLDAFAPNEAFEARSSYSGFQINFIFKSNLFKDSLAQARNKLTFAFEVGLSNADLYQIVVNDTSRLSYSFNSDIFRLTFGYKYSISKKGKFRIYTGAELVNEFNISAAVFESQFGRTFEGSVRERKLFARKGYNLYANVPFGFDWKAFKKASIFLHINIALGFENLDPIRQMNLYTGTRLGVSLSI